MEKPPRSWGEMTIQFFDELIFFSQNWIGNNFHYYRYWKTSISFWIISPCGQIPAKFPRISWACLLLPPPKTPLLWPLAPGGCKRCLAWIRWWMPWCNNLGWRWRTKPCVFCGGEDAGDTTGNVYHLQRIAHEKKRAPNKQDKWSPKTTGSAVNLQIAIPKSPSLLAHTILATGVLGNIESLHWHILPWLGRGYAVLTTCCQNCSSKWIEFVIDDIETGAQEWEIYVPYLSSSQLPNSTDILVVGSFK